MLSCGKGSVFLLLFPADVDVGTDDHDRLRPGPSAGRGGNGCGLLLVRARGEEQLPPRRPARPGLRRDDLG